MPNRLEALTWLIELFILDASASIHEYRCCF
jgi:hypothetical protein